MDYDDSYVDWIDKDKLERYKYCAVQRLSREFAETAKVNYSFFETWAEDTVTIMITQAIWGQKITDNITISYPYDWWQAFKERWFPDLLLKLYPVKYSKTSLDLVELYPKLKPPPEYIKKVCTARIHNFGKARIEIDGRNV